MFAKNKPVESTDYETGLPDATSTEVHDELLFDDSNNDVMTNMHCYVCRKARPDIAGKTEFVTGKKFKT